VSYYRSKMNKKQHMIANYDQTTCKTLRTFMTPPN
jgi:hypothetical protein